MTDKIDNLKKGIAAYMEEQKILLRLLRRKGKITDVEFDRFFSEHKIETDERGYSRLYRRAPRLRFLSGDKDAFLLGSPIQGDWGKWLHLLQLMVTIGLVQIAELGNDYIYSPTTKGLQLLAKAQHD